MHELAAEASRLCQELDPTSVLPPVMGAGCLERPALALVFINPTARNLSVRPDWDGPQLPFVGNSELFRTLSSAGVLPPNLALTLRRARWTPELAREVYDEVRRSRIYITNVVKCTGRSGALPNRAVIEAFTPLLRQELVAASPKLIVAMGILPFQALTGRTLRLQDVLADARRGAGIRVHESVDGHPVAPCYFPVGRGRRSLARELLARIVAEFEASRPDRGSTSRTRRTSGRSPN